MYVKRHAIYSAVNTCVAITSMLRCPVLYIPISVLFSKSSYSLWGLQSAVNIDAFVYFESTQSSRSNTPLPIKLNGFGQTLIFSIVTENVRLTYINSLYSTKNFKILKLPLDSYCVLKLCKYQKKQDRSYLPHSKSTKRKEFLFLPGSTATRVSRVFIFWAASADTIL